LERANFSGPSAIYLPNPRSFRLTMSGASMTADSRRMSAAIAPLLFPPKKRTIHDMSLDSSTTRRGGSIGPCNPCVGKARGDVFHERFQSPNVSSSLTVTRWDWLRVARKSARLMRISTGWRAL